MEEVLNFITLYNLPIFIISLCTVVLIGLLKLCKVFSRIKSADLKKFIYLSLDIILSFGGVAILFAVEKVDFNWNYALCSLKQVAATTSLYAIYENFGVRKFVRIIGGLLAKWLVNLAKKNPDNEVSKLVKKYGFEKILSGVDKALEKARVKPSAVESPRVSGGTAIENVRK